MIPPLISVLIPCFNAEKYIGETLEAVFRQTWRNLEVVVINDGSDDTSADVVKRFARPNLIFHEQPNRGAATSRNAAFAVSKGEYIQFLDADDLISSEKLALQMARLQGNPGCVASAEWGRFYEDPTQASFEPEPVWRDMDPIDWIALSELRMLFPALWLIPRDIVTRTGPWIENLTLADDREYFTRMLLHADRVLFCPGARAYYRSGLDGSLSDSKSPEAWASQYRVNTLCEEYLLARESTPRMRRMMAINWQEYAHAAYPYDPSGAEMAISRARHLDPQAIIKPEGGIAFRVLSALAGWRLARRLQVLTGRR
jgi:glycosyltransferase involved in cell wall biosynthesis